MVAIRQGEWSILSIEVDAHSVLDTRDFQRLELQGDELVIRPSGLRFTIQQATSSRAVLESRGQVFFADYSSTNEDELRLEFSRQQFDEIIRIRAEYAPAASF